MTVSSAVHAAVAPAIDARRRLFLIWQNPDTRRFIRVGALTELVDGRYVFAYSPDAGSGGFNPLVQFPDVHKTYVSDALPAFFINRVMTSQRQSYPAYLSAIGLDTPGLDTPMELLARTGGARVTDTFHLVDDFTADPDGVVVTRFLASGVRHVDGATDALNRVRPGDRLELRPDATNPINPRAQLVCAESGDELGYVPDWLLDDLDGLLARAGSYSIIAERVNPDEHPHLRLLCRIEARV